MVTAVEGLGEAKGHVRLGERLSVKVSNLTTLLSESEVKDKPITLFVNEANRSKSSWLQDVLTDDIGGVALHRFQVLLWTFVLGGVFIGSIIHALSMPDFSPTLLALMGISSGTYLGFKFPVNT